MAADAAAATDPVKENASVSAGADVPMTAAAITDAASARTLAVRELAATLAVQNNVPQDLAVKEIVKTELVKSSAMK